MILPTRTPDGLSAYLDRSGKEEARDSCQSTHRKLLPRLSGLRLLEIFAISIIYPYEALTCQKVPGGDAVALRIEHPENA